MTKRQETFPLRYVRGLQKRLRDMAVSKFPKHAKKPKDHKA